ncbi:hypothetical protein K501DRAFT_276319 [Backusella circina FSU 941]|nr:hypothetical protein K501DRAFT_276319 [Backusella circina FSU 941]
MFMDPWTTTTQSRFQKKEVDKYYSSIYLDPDGKHVFTSVNESGLKNNEVGRSLTKEYYTITGSLNYQRSLDKEKINCNVKRTETDIHTGKTTNVTKYEKYVKYKPSNLTSLFQVKFKGLQSGVTGILWRALKKRENNTSSLIVVTIDGFRTSRVYCSLASLPDYIYDLAMLKDSEFLERLLCSQCEKYTLKGNSGYELDNFGCIIWMALINNRNDYKCCIILISNGGTAPVFFGTLIYCYGIPFYVIKMHSDSKKYMLIGEECNIHPVVLQLRKSKWDRISRLQIRKLIRKDCATKS